MGLLYNPPANSLYLASYAIFYIVLISLMSTVTLTKPLEPSQGCIASATNIIGSKWTALILRDLFSGPKRFCELEKSVSQINPRTLSQRLDDLEDKGIISRRAHHEVPPRIEYALTAKGKDLLPILRQMAAWGNKYHSC
jgi:DNA-binding HxlR family transcriptional regulator